MENVFIKLLGDGDDFSGIVVKLGDFGLSTYYDPSQPRMPGYFGTPVMWPPEQTWEGREARPAGDVWATGSIVHELAHGFPPVVSPQLTKSLLKEEARYPVSTWDEGFQKQFYDARSERKPLPINLDTHEDDPRRRRPTPRYSDKLNECMMAALDIGMDKRPTAGELFAMVEQEHAAHVSRKM